jgi:hypothetical protein
MQADRVSLVDNPPDDVAGLIGDVVVDQEECRARISRRQRIEQRWRPHRVRPIVEGQVDRRLGRMRVHPPNRLRRPERFEQERKRRGMRQRQHADAQQDKREHSTILV